MFPISQAFLKIVPLFIYTKSRIVHSLCVCYSKKKTIVLTTLAF
jgi:hypothetical protein